MMNSLLRRLRQKVAQKQQHGPILENYRDKLAAEIEAFRENEEVHDLPEIFHYWSNKYLLPIFQPHGIAHPEQFFFLYTNRALAVATKPMRIISIGAGNCDMETRLASELKQTSARPFTIECTDINQHMLDRGAEHARSLGVEDSVVFQNSDFNRWEPAGEYDVIIANQCLHHVVELEHLFDAIAGAMGPHSLFLTSDMIGRNGHQRWPEALELVNEFWQELPKSYRWNRLLKRQEQAYMNHDCSTEGFEGIRAQDILALLTERFQFELFLPFLNIVSVFIDRPFGGNFDASADWDRNFIDRVHQRDVEGMLSGELKPTQMLAVLRTSDFTESTAQWHPKMTPEACIRPPD
ncbi:MAG: class I SAM-dependent methyltransferase [Pseudomonadota bacterium]